MNFALFSLLAAAVPATAPSLKIDMGNGGGQVQMSMPVQVLILLTLMTFLPAIVISLSSFTRIIIVFHFS